MYLDALTFLKSRNFFSSFYSYLTTKKVSNIIPQNNSAFILLWKTIILFNTIIARSKNSSKNEFDERFHL